MRGAILRDYFIGNCTAEDLKSELKGSMISRRDITEHHIEDMDVDFEVTPEHLIKLCDDILEGHLDPIDLQSIGFCIIASDHFTWDEDTTNGDRVAEAVHDWSTPEINYSLNRENVQLFKERLGSGGNPCSSAD
jgi:hypothetical protein